jgi:hypothetical protein
MTEAQEPDAFVGGATLPCSTPAPWKTACLDELLQLRVLRLGFLQEGDVGVGVFPEGEEVFVGGERPDAGDIGIRPLRGSRASAPVQQFQTMPLWSRIF